MNLFGFVAIVFVLALMTWWFSANVGQIHDSTSENSVYQNTIDAAREAAERMGE